MTLNADGGDGGDGGDAASAANDGTGMCGGDHTELQSRGQALQGTYSSTANQPTTQARSSERVELEAVSGFQLKDMG